MSRNVHKIRNTLSLPEQLPALSRGSKSTEMRHLQVVFRGSSSTYPAVRHLPWLVNYMAKEIALGGVGLIDEELEQNCEVPGLHMSWEFGNAAWKAEFVSGPLQGCPYSCAVSHMMLEKWATTSLEEAVPFETASFLEKKEGVRLFLQAYRVAVAAGSSVMPANPSAAAAGLDL